MNPTETTRLLAEAHARLVTFVENHVKTATEAAR